ncbi:hypothetical protein PVAP13_3NG235263 [Panicum virgatum]|uniref:Uncharacterized protein n=1 Tax=Panicum virgatum TaxID=38727 RepID=A0A8T0UIL2_PANVG|nr:hypothetical protein PVAP13_3NG235263 [Panicum virgatum]
MATRAPGRREGGAKRGVGEATDSALGVRPGRCQPRAATLRSGKTASEAGVRPAAHSGAGKRPPRPVGGSSSYAEDARHERRKGLRQGRVKRLRRAARPPRPACHAALAHAAIKGGERGYAAGVRHAAQTRHRLGRGKGLRRAAHPPRGWPPWPAPPPSCEALSL